MVVDQGLEPLAPNLVRGNVVFLGSLLSRGNAPLGGRANMKGVAVSLLDKTGFGQGADLKCILPIP